VLDGLHAKWGNSRRSLMARPVSRCVEAVVIGRPSAESPKLSHYASLKMEEELNIILGMFLGLSNLHDNAFTIFTIS
jgi:hypothetical protein